MTGKSEAWFTPSIHALQYQSVVVGRSQICCGRRGRAHRLRAPRGRSGQARQERKKYAFVPRPRPNALTALHQRRSSSRCDIFATKHRPCLQCQNTIGCRRGSAGGIGFTRCVNATSGMLRPTPTLLWWCPRQEIVAVCKVLPSRLWSVRVECRDAPDPPHSARCESLFACGACTGRV
jgi:hypothetical protein